MERTIYGEIVQIKTERRVPVYRCAVIETVVSQYCGFLSAGGVVRYLKFREPRRVEAQDCRRARTTGRLTIGGKEYQVTAGTTTSHSTFLAGDLTDTGDCSTGTMETVTGAKLGGQAAQAVYEITVSEELAKVNDLSGTITLDNGIASKVGDLSLMDSMVGTYVWDHEEEACSKTLIQLYLSLIHI